MCYHAKFGRPGLKGVDVNTGEPQKLGDWNSTVLAWEAWNAMTNMSGDMIETSVNDLFALSCQILFG